MSFGVTMIHKYHYIYIDNNNAVLISDIRFHNSQKHKISNSKKEGNRKNSSFLIRSSYQMF